VVTEKGRSGGGGEKGGAGWTPRWGIPIVDDDAKKGEDEGDETGSKKKVYEVFL